MTLGRWNGQGSLTLSETPCELVSRGQETPLPDGLEVSAVGRQEGAAGPAYLSGHLRRLTLVHLCLLPLALGHSCS